MMLHADTSQWSRLADKYAVREYVKDCGFEEELVKLYGAWNNANEIDFDKLPDSFVLKTNHGCGDAIFVKTKKDIDKEKITSKLNHALNTDYGYNS